MAFTYNTVNEDKLNGRRILYGTYTNSGGSTGGAVTPGKNTTTTTLPQYQAMSKIENVQLTPVSATVLANAHVVNTALPANASAFTVVTTANESGVWSAIGY